MKQSERQQITTEAESRMRGDALAVQGRLLGQPTATFTLTVTPDSCLMTLQDVENAWLYRVVGDTATGIGQVTEIDLMRIPPILGSPPIVPPGH